MNLNYSRAYEEEKLTALWSMCAILCFGFEFDVAAYLFTIKAIFDFLCANKYAYIEAKEEIILEK